ncbi:metal ABC transporter permease [Alphaproteobacteria bacterium LSUCC0684]
MDSFILMALIAGTGIAIVTGVMGCFVVWRRMAYFGDSLAHSAMLGIAIGFGFGIGISTGILLVCSGFAILLLWLQQRGVLATDTLLGILAHGALSSGVVLISLSGISVDLHALLFGDILTVMPTDIAVILGGGTLVLILVYTVWPRLVLMTLSEDLASAEGIDIFRMRLLFLFLMTLVVAVSVRMVGILLITSMLIIPAATARPFARSPETMALLAVLVGIIGVISGVNLSLAADIPTGPSIVLILTSLFAFSMIASALSARLQIR